MISKQIKVLLIILYILVPIACHADTLRIGLVRLFNNAQQVVVYSDTDLSFSDSKGHVLTTLTAGSQVTLCLKNGKVSFSANGSDCASAKEIEIASVASGGLIKLENSTGGSAKYRGKIIVKVDGSSLLLINIVDLEDYLLSVLPSEMPSVFQIEAQKAQAISARTFAWATHGKHKKDGYDLCDSTDCQMYEGVSHERTASTEAVKATAGMVMTYNGKLISAMYCSDCGGRTKDGNSPYLCSVTDKPEGSSEEACEHDGHSWTKSWTVDEFEKMLQKSHPRIKDIKNICVTDQDGSGRAESVKIDCGNGSTAVDGTDFRSLFGNSVIKSTFFTAKIENGNVLFEGKGFGHGIGLCQFGANGLASSPYNYTYDRILKHYYRGIEIVQLGAVTIARRIEPRMNTDWHR